MEGEEHEAKPQKVAPLPPTVANNDNKVAILPQEQKKSSVFKEPAMIFSLVNIAILIIAGGYFYYELDKLNKKNKELEDKINNLEGIVKELNIKDQKKTTSLKDLSSEVKSIIESKNKVKKTEESGTVKKVKKISKQKEDLSGLLDEVSSKTN